MDIRMADPAEQDIEEHVMRSEGSTLDLEWTQGSGGTGRTIGSRTGRTSLRDDSRRGGRRGVGRQEWHRHNSHARRENVSTAESRLAAILATIRLLISHDRVPL
jgi:hypothetical protein